MQNQNVLGSGNTWNIPILSLWLVFHFGPHRSHYLSWLNYIQPNFLEIFQSFRIVIDVLFQNENILKWVSGFVLCVFDKYQLNMNNYKTKCNYYYFFQSWMKLLKNYWTIITFKSVYFWRRLHKVSQYAQLSY